MNPGGAVWSGTILFAHSFPVWVIWFWHKIKCSISAMADLCEVDDLRILDTQSRLLPQEYFL